MQDEIQRKKLGLAARIRPILVGAQTWFLQGPAMHSNMASDYWEPGHFRDLSARLVRQNRMIVVGAACLAIMLWTQGEAAVLVVL